MKPRRSVAWAVVVLALLVHLVAGIAGPGMQLCVCATGITIAPQHTACCGIEVVPEVPADAPDGCTECHIMPLPDAAAATISPAPSLLPMAVLPNPVQIAVIVWPRQLEPSLGRPRGYPPDPKPRHVRTMILTC